MEQYICGQCLFGERISILYATEYFRRFFILEKCNNKENNIRLIDITALIL